MKNFFFYWTLFCSVILFYPYADARSATFEDEIEILRTRLYEEYYTTSNPLSENLCMAQKNDGSWADIDYTSKALAYWPSLNHLQRVKGLAHLYAGETNKSSEFAKKMKDAVNNGLTFWEQRKPTSNNWWYQDIGKQKEFIPILILMGDAIPVSMQNALCRYLVITATNASGANLTDMATGLLVRGVVQRNVSYINDAVTRIASVGKIQNKGKDGVQVDNSYLFHNQQIFSINYNVVTLRAIAMWINMLRGLSFQFPDIALTTTRDVLLEGNRWMFCNDRVDWATSGRFITIPTALNVATYRQTTQLLRTADPDNRGKYDDFLAVVNQERKDTLVGNKYFFRAEYMVNRSPNFFYSVRMSSTRISGSEMGNGQNLKGYWLGMGANCLMRDAREYDSIFPLWDWTKVPGTTAANELPTFGFELKQGSNFSGGVSNGIDGIASMQINQRGLMAKKSWFVFDNEVVCLGNGISGITNQNAIFSTIEQRRKQGNVLVNGQEIGLVSNQVLENPTSIYHDSTLYLFPKPQKLTLSSERRTNNWKSISNIESKEMITDTVFALWYDHGRMPSNADYSYITVPFIKPEEIENYTRNIPVRILQATHNVHVVTHDKKQLTGAVFFSKGTVSIDSLLDIEVSRPCILMIDQSCEPIKLMVSDPTQSYSSVRVTLKHKNFRAEGIEVQLPIGNYMGSAATFHSDIDRNQPSKEKQTIHSDIKIGVIDHTITLSGMQENDQLALYDFTGNSIFRKQVTNSVAHILVPQQGVYIVSINNETQKVLVK